MTGAQLRRVRIDRIVLRDRRLTPGDELVLRTALRRALDERGAPGRVSDPEPTAAEVGTAIAAVVRTRVDATVAQPSTPGTTRHGGQRR